MNVFIYDRTFEGLLCAIFDAYTLRFFPDALLAEGEAGGLLGLCEHRVETRPDKAGRVFAALRRKLSREAVGRMILVWLSEEAGSDFLLFRHMRLVLDSTGFTETDYADPLVMEMCRLARKVNGERYQLTGFLRFQRTSQDVYFAAVAPRHNVLQLLLPHFAERFADQQWLIYDERRGFGVFFDKDEFHEAALDPAALKDGKLQGGRLDESLLADNELLFQQLWQGYFRAASVTERANPRLQARCMPRRFWKYLTEMR